MPPPNGTVAVQGRQPAPRPLPPPTPASLTTEYVSGGHYGFYGTLLARALSHPIDDLTETLGDDVYAQMLKDAQVSACISILKASVLEDGVDLSPALQDETEDGYDLAVQIRDEADRMFGDLELSMDDVLWDMLNALVFGNRVAEQRFELRTAYTSSARLLQLAALKPKPPAVTFFVVDAFNNVLGLLAQPPNQPAGYMGQWVINPNDPPKNLLSREKFAIVTFRPENSDPRGTSILRSAYRPWWKKQQIDPEHLKYLAQFGSPSLVGKTAPGATTLPPMDVFGNVTTDPASTSSPPATEPPSVDVSADFTQAPPNPAANTLSPEQKMLAALLKFRNSSAIVVPSGAEVVPVEMNGDGTAFLKAFAQSDQQITKAILTQELATEQGEHQARAAAQVHQDVLDTIVRQTKRSVQRVLYRDVLRPWVTYNWGEKVAAKLTPQPTLGTTEQQDLAPLMTAVANLQRASYLHPSQLPDIDEMLGLPVRDLTQDELEPVEDAGVGRADGTQQPASGGPSNPPDDQAPSDDSQQEQQQDKPTPEPVPPNRVPVRGHTRRKPARRADEELEV